MMQTVTVDLRDKLYELYRIKNKSTYQIARLYGVSDWTIRQWMDRYGIARRNRSIATKLALSSPEIRRRMSLGHRRKFEAIPSPYLGYVLGVLRGDGYVSKYQRARGGYNYQICLYAKDRDFTEKFAKALKEIGLNPFTFANKRGFHQAVANSADFYEWYKPLDLKQIRKLIEGYEEYFARGFYESEGHIGIHKWGSMFIRMYNNCRDLLLMVKDIIGSWGIESRIHGPYKYSCFVLEIYGNDQVERFLNIAKPCIKTKLRNTLICHYARNIFSMGC